MRLAFQMKRTVDSYSPQVVNTPDSTPANYLGKAFARTDGIAKVTGAVRYTGDLTPSGLLHARLVVSPHAHARILGIDRTAAEQVPGVVRVLLAEDLNIAPSAVGQRKRDPLARDRVLYHGHPVAVVVATSEVAADDAAGLVAVEYEPLPVVADPVEAVRPDAPTVRDDAVDDEEARIHGAVATDSADAPTHPNVSSTVRFSLGDVEAGFASAEVVVERTYRTPWVHQAYLEPQVAIADWDGPDHVTVWASTQAIFFTRGEIAAALGIGRHQVTVVPMPVGGAFGGKFVLVEPLAAAVARVLRRPVRLAYRRMDEFVTANPAAASTISLRLGATRDGRITALASHLTFDTGSSPSSAAKIAPTLIGGQYRIPNLEVVSQEVLTNKAGGGSYRAPGAVQVYFAVESAIDELAREIGMDPLALRILNAAEEGDLRATNAPWPRIGLKECLARLEQHPLWIDRERLGRGARDERGRAHGIGIAIGGWPGGLEPATAACRVDDDGRLTITVGAVDISGTHTGFALIAAEAFGIDPESVRVVISDSDTAPHSGGSGGSKITYTVGAAVQRAAADARRQVLEIAAEHLEVAPEDLELKDGRVCVSGAPEHAMTVQEVAQLALTGGGRYEPIYGRGSSAIDRNAPGFGVHLARVAVDLATAEVEVVDYVVVQDVGRALNPAEVAGQVHGGVAQGIGWALYERIVHSSQAQVMTGSFLDYALPKAVRIPNIETILLEVPSEDGPFGAKGVGEPPVIPVAAAIANAVEDAIGVRITDLPLTSERVYQGLVEQATGGIREGYEQ